MALYKVTALNLLTGNRFTVLDNITLSVAQRIKAKFGNKNDVNFYLPEIKIEEM